MSKENTNTIDTSDETINKGWDTIETTIIDNPVIDPIEPDEQAEEQAAEHDDAECADMLYKMLKMGLGNSKVNVDITKIDEEIMKCAQSWNAFINKRFGGMHGFLERYGVEVMMVFNTGYLLFTAADHRKAPTDQEEVKAGAAPKTTTQTIDPL